MDTISAIVFDLDDTLYLQRTYKESGCRCVARWLAQQHGFDSVKVYKKLLDIIDRFGPSYPSIFDQLLFELNSCDINVEDLIRIFLDHHFDIDCFPGTRELLGQLQTSYRLGLLTDGRESTQKRKVEALDIGHFFDHILYSDSLGLEKPAALLYQFFEEKFKLSGAEIAYIGDNPAKDFIAAKNRGWLTIRVHTGEFAQSTCNSQEEAEYHLNSLADLWNILPISAERT